MSFSSCISDKQTNTGLLSCSKLLLLLKVIEENKAVKKEKWVKDNQGQLIITAGQVVWTSECEKALADPDQAKSALRHLKKKWISYLNKLTAITCSQLNKIERNKVLTWRQPCIQVHTLLSCTKLLAILPQTKTK